MKLLENKPEFVTKGLSVIRNAIAFGSVRENNDLEKTELKNEPTESEITGDSVFQNLTNGLYLTGTFLGLNDGYLAQ